MASNIKTAVGRFAAATSTGLQELTIAGLGWTPKAAKFTIVGAAANATFRDHVTLGTGVVGPDGASGYNEGAVGASSQHGVGTTSQRRQQRTDACLIAIEPGSPFTFARATGDGDGGAGNPGPIANGWRVNWQVAPTAAFYIVAQFFGGVDLQAHADSFMLDSDNAIDVTGPGFRPSCVFFHSMGDQGLAETTSQYNRVQYGWAVDNAGVLQGGGAIASRNGVGTSETALYLSSSGIPKASHGGFNYEVAVSDFDSSGFTVTPSTAAGDEEYYHYLALDTADRAVWLGVVDAPTSAASDWTISAPGFRPQMLDLLAANAALEDTQYTTSPEAESLCIGVSDGADAFCALGFWRDAQSTTNMASLSQDGLARTAEGNRASTHDISGAPSFTETGWVVPASSIATADSTTRKWLGFAIEAVSAASHTRSSSLQGALSKQRSISGAVGAALSANRSVDVQADASLLVLSNLAADLDLILEAGLDLQTGLNAALSGEEAGFLLLDVALTKAGSAVSALDSGLSRSNVDLSGLDGALSKDEARAALLDALLLELGVGSSALDAVLRGTSAGSASLDGARSKSLSLSAGNDACLAAGRVLTLLLGAATSRALSLTNALDAVVQAENALQRTVDLEGALQAVRSTVSSMQAALQKAGYLSVGFDAAMQVRSVSLLTSLGAAMQQTADVVATLSAAVRLMRSLIVGLNAALQDQAALSNVLDAVLGAPSAAYSPRGARSYAVSERGDCVIGPGNRVIIVPARPRRH